MAASPTNRTLQEVSSSVYPKLERVPGKQNWVDKAGGLPNYIERIAKHLHYEKGKSISTAIAMAVNTVKRWATGTNHNGSKLKPDTVAKAQAAVAEWEAKKAKAKGANLAEAYAEAPAGITLDADDRASLYASFVHRLTLIEGFALNLRGQATKGKAEAVASATALLEGNEARLTIGGRGNAEPRQLARIQSALGAEAAELRATLTSLNEGFEGPQTKAARAAVKREAKAKGRNGKAVFDESQHPRAGKGQPTGGQFIRKGATGAEVKGIQRHLGVKADGRFGNETKKAVEAFQKKHGLEVDGVVGAQTAGALRGAEAIPGPLLSHHRSGLRKLSKGVSAQYSPAALAAADAKEKRENRARKARKEAKKKAESKAKSSTTSSSSSSSSSSGGAGSTLGPSSDLPKDVVQLIQRRLGINTSGSYDEATEKAIRKFQREHGLLVDGIVGTQTLAALRGDESPPEPGAFTETDWTWLTSHQAGGQRRKRHRKQAQHRQEREEKKEERELRSRVEEAMVKDDFVRRYGAGMTGAPDEATGHLQRRLTELGYEAGADDGRYGEKTKGAVSQFQADHGLKEDGEVGHDTKLALRGTDPEEVARRRSSQESPEKSPGKPMGDNEGEESKAAPEAKDGEAESIEDPGKSQEESGEKEPSERHSLAGAVLTKGAGVDAEDPDPSVEQMQSIIGTEVDGRFGPETEKKLKSTQRRYGLKADGVVGPKTGRLLDRMASKHKPDPKKMEEAALDAAVLDRMEAAASGDHVAFTRARARENFARTRLEESSLRGAASDALREFYRLDDGTFAPKGMGRILTPGEEIHLPHQSGKGTVRAKIEAGAKGKGLARILEGPDKGRLAGVRTAAPEGRSPHAFPKPLNSRPASLPQMPRSASWGEHDRYDRLNDEARAQSHLDAMNHHITAGDEQAVQDYVHDAKGEADHYNQFGGNAGKRWEEVEQKGNAFLEGEKPKTSGPTAEEIGGWSDSILERELDYAAENHLDLKDPDYFARVQKEYDRRQAQRAPIDFTAKSEGELDKLASEVSDETGTPRTNFRDRSIFKAIMQERGRRATQAYRDAKDEQERSRLADVVAQLTGRRPKDAPTPAQAAPPEGFTPNAGEVQMKEMGPGDTFYVGKHDMAYRWHKPASGDFIIAKPLDGGKAKVFHKEFAPPFIGPKDESAAPAAAAAAPDQGSVYDALKASVAQTANPKSPARSPAGNLRNFKAMSDEKLMNLAVEMKGHPDDVEAVKAITTELQARGDAKSEPDAITAAPNLPKTHEPAKVKSADQKIEAAWGAYEKKKAEFDALPADADKATRSKLASQVRAAKFRIKRVGGDPDKPPTKKEVSAPKAKAPKKVTAKPKAAPSPPLAPAPTPPAAATPEPSAPEVRAADAKNLSATAEKLGGDWTGEDIKAALDKLETSGLVFDRENESPDTLAAVIKAAGLNPADLKTIGTTS